MTAGEGGNAVPPSTTGSSGSPETGPTGWTPTPPTPGWAPSAPQAGWTPGPSSSAGQVPPGPEPPPAAGAPGSWPDQAGGRGWERAARRADRAARREARRAARRGQWGLGAAFWGLFLILVGAGILAAQFLPGFDWDLAWPIGFVAFGVLLVAASIRRAPQAP